jgi:hypothetical protein
VELYIKVYSGTKYVELGVEKGYWMFFADLGGVEGYD